MFTSFVHHHAQLQDASLDIVNTALLHIDCCYRFPAFRGTGRAARTNTPSNTVLHQP